VLAFVKDGKILKIEGDPEHPYNEGRLCSKGLAVKQLVYNPDRLLYPMKRIGQRGEGKWQRISWDEALDTIANKLNEIKAKEGAQAVVFGHGTDRSYFHAVPRFCNAFGTPNWTEPGDAQCWFPKMVAELTTFGRTLQNNIEDYDKTRCIVLWGASLYTNDAIFSARVMWAKALGSKIITVDPKFSAAASKADIWIQLRP
jgi:anaerobic selenocysteine-containing dehydrogenase